MRTSLIESLEPRTLFAGVTIIVNGRLGIPTNDWQADMAADITSQLGGPSQVPQYDLTVTAAASGALQASLAHVDGTATPQTNTTGEIIVQVDYVTVSDITYYSSTYIGQVIANCLMTTPADGILLTSLPIHEIGVSRGAAVIDGISQTLGQAGIWVDQQTYLDPYPIPQQGDPPNTIYDNVAFVDDYWRNDGSQAQTDDGNPVNGAYNLNVYWLDSEDAGWDIAHLTPAGYYIGTIDPTATTATDGPIYSEWYGDTPTMPARDATGWIYSDQIGAPRPLSGVWAASGGTGARTAAGQAGTQWGNATDLTVLGGSTVSSGGSMQVNYLYEDRDSADTATFYLDSDRNPYNNSFVANLGSFNLAQTSSPTQESNTLSLAGVAPGTYWLCEKITDPQGDVRYTYESITAPLTVQNPGAVSGTFIDAGGPAAGSYVADTDFSGGGTFSTTSSINTSADPTGAPQSVYQSERYGNFTYTVPNLVAGNSYSVLLHFAEIYWNSAGQRLFNVSINGTQVLTNFDIFATAGGADKAIVESFNATANASGQITIAFTSVKDNAKVDAIDVVPTTVAAVAPAVTTNPQNQSVTTGQTVSFTAAASGSPTPTVQWQVSSGGGAFTNITGNASATTTTLTLPAVGTALNGNKYQAVFTNGVGAPATTTAATLTVNAATTGTFIDAGGPAVGSYVADTDFSGGGTYSTGSSINTSADPTGAPASVYQSERYGNFTYTVPNLVAGNSYSVLLHFAEIYWNSAGQRLVNVSINGTQVLTNFDIFATAGGADKAIVESFNATANASGQITIVFTSVKDNAKVDAIDVVPTTVAAVAPAVTTNPQNQSVTAGQTVSFTAAASGSPTPTVQWQVSSGGGAFTNITGNASATTTTLTLPAVGTALNGNKYQAVFTNGVGAPATTTAATLTVNAATTGTFIDAGGPAVGSYVADTDFSGSSSTYSTASSINTSADPTGAPASVYQSERYGNFTYTVPNLVAGNSYSVLLHFAELYWNSAGQRLFNVSINGTQVLTNFDIFATAGGADKAIVESFNATANASGQITIVFTSVKDNAKVSAIDIVPA